MKIRRVIRSLKWFLFICGILFVTTIGAAFTNLPWAWYQWLAEPEPNHPGSPDCIVMMGGGGIPSESGLTRAWKTAEAAVLFPDATVIVAMPDEESKPAIRTIEHELSIRGVSLARIMRERNGRNTRGQALEVFKQLRAQAEKGEVMIGLVTSPEHMRRTWASFKKAGFLSVNSYPSWSKEIEADLAYDEKELGGTSLLGNVGGNMTARYRLWDNLVIMTKCAREMIALAYYRLLGWI